MSAPDSAGGQTREGDIVLEARAAALAYGGRTVLHSLDFAVRAGESVALIGPNGSGKSTLLKGVLGSVPLVSGSLSVLGATAGPATRSMIGYLPQEDTRQRGFPVTVAHVVMMGRYRALGWFRMPGHADREAVRDALAQVGLSGLARRQFGELSGGQQQRVILARALVSGPRLLLLDEPFNGLDEENREALIATIDRLRASGVAILVSTHDLELARRVCDTVLLLNGRQIDYGPRDRVLARMEASRTPGAAEATG